jgi:hypothetical protein
MHIGRNLHRICRGIHGRHIKHFGANDVGVIGLAAFCILAQNRVGAKDGAGKAENQNQTWAIRHGSSLR